MVDHNKDVQEFERGHLRSHSTTKVSPDSDMLSEGIHGYEQTTESILSQQVKNFINRTLVPLLLVTAMPNMVILMWYTVIHCDGSYLRALAYFSNKSFIAGLTEMWYHVHKPSLSIITILIGYCIYALLMMRALPGNTVYGPVTPKGNIPAYKDNGFKYFILTITLFWVLTFSLRPWSITPSVVYDRFGEVLFTLNAFSLIFCLFLYIKGRFWPSSTDFGSSGNVTFDYYWGMELYPRVLGFDIKLFTNCRFGMMAWALLVCVHLVKSYETNGFVDSIFVTAFLQLLYITKFFWWEAGYLRTIDIILDRAGFYICWGCLVYVPGFYASVPFYLVSHPVHLGPMVSVIILSLGALCIYINFSADDQKQKVRDTEGNCLVWGQKPDLIHAKYQLENGKVRENILLASGWWGLSRHFHYIPEILSAFFWSVPAMFNHLFPYSHLIFLLILLTHRSYRDDSKCRQKYGQFWIEYSKKVPHRIVPYLF